VKYKASGKLEIKSGVRIIAPVDFILYYQKLFTMATWNTIKSQTPQHGAHISIVLPKIHGEAADLSPIHQWNGKRIEFEYNPLDIIITKKNVWMKVKCDEAENIKKILGITDKNFLGFHMTILNFKNL
jgi:hypothetical protein